MVQNDENLNHLTQALAKDPSDTRALWQRAVALLQRGNLDAALIDLYNLLRLEPRNLEARNQIRFIHQKLVPNWHFDMLNDSVRNDAYERAINHSVKQGITVFEIGTGSGLLSMLAARAGARHVWTCEKSMPIRRAAELIIRQNGFADKITILDAWSTSVSIPQHIPEKVDLIIGEIFGAGLLEEQAIHFFNDARSRLLKPGGKILPARATMFGALIDGKDISQRAIVGEVCGFDLRLFNGLHDDPALQINLAHHPHTFLSEPFILKSIDFNSSPPKEGEETLTVTIKNSGTCTGVAQWFRLEFDGGIAFDTAPTSPRTHWDQHIQVFEKQFEVISGREMKFLVRQFSDRFSLHRTS